MTERRGERSDWSEMSEGGEGGDGRRTKRWGDKVTERRRTKGTK